MRNNVIQVAKATCAAVVFALVYALVFTLVIKIFCLPSEVIKPVNQVFKILSIAAGGLLFIRDENGLVKGACLGVAAVVATYLLFSLISGSFAVTPAFVAEPVIGAVAGAVTGIIAVNIKKR